MKCFAPQEVANFSASALGTFLLVSRSALLPAMVRTIPFGTFYSSSVTHFLALARLSREVMS